MQLYSIAIYITGAWLELNANLVEYMLDWTPQVAIIPVIDLTKYMQLCLYVYGKGLFVEKQRRMYESMRKNRGKKKINEKNQKKY